MKVTAWSALLAGTLLCACGGGSPQRAATRASAAPPPPPFLTAFIPAPKELPARGTVEWAMAVRAAKDDAARATAPEAAVLRAYGRLLALYRGCADCERLAYKGLAGKVKWRPDNALQSDARALMAEDPVGFAEGLGSGRRDEARALAISWAETLPFHEQRAELYRLAGGLTPMEDPRGVPPDKRDLERNRLLRHAYDEMPATNQVQLPPDADPSIAAQVRFLEQNPDRADPEQLADLASRVEDAKLRATLLLSAAFRCEQRNKHERARQLMCEAGAAATDDPRIQSALRLNELWSLPYHGDEETWKRAAEAIIQNYPTYELSCTVCSQYLDKINPVTESSARHFIEVCRSQLDRCPRREWMWRRLTRQPGPPDARVVDELLLASDPPADNVPGILLALSAITSDADPARAAELEDEALRLPNVPWLDVAALRPMQRAGAAERRGDFKRALFWTVVAGPQMTCGTAPWTDACYAFWESYFSLRAGMDVDRQWGRLLSSVPATLDDEGMPLLQVDQLDRLTCAASLVGRLPDLAERLRALATRHREAMKPELAADRHDKLRRIELVLRGYVADIEAGRARCTP